MRYHKVTENIIKLLEDNKVWFETFEHRPVRTSEEAAKVRTGYTMEEGAKALILRVKKKGNKKFVMLVIPGDLRFDGSKTKKVLGSNDIRFATEKEISDLTQGVVPGGVPPFGNLFDIEVIADPLLLENDRVVFNAGDQRFSIGMKSSDYVSLVDPQIVSIT